MNSNLRGDRAYNERNRMNYTRVHLPHIGSGAING
jgi:hypothetical protein